MSNGRQSVFPLEGIRVLDLTRLIPGAFCTAILGDAGAEIVKVEEAKTGDYEREIRPFIESMASRFLILNRNKKSIALNLKGGEGQEIFLKMASKADVLVEGFRPGAMKKLGLDYESLRKVNQRLVYCSISSFGQEGPFRDVVAHDVNLLGLAGFFHVTGVKGGAPVIPGLQIADSVAGMNAALAILFALMNREKTGKGQQIDISMFDGVVSWMFDAVRYAFAGESVPGKGKGRLNGGLPNYNLYETKDGKHVAVGSLETKFKNTLLKKLGRGDLIEEGEGITTSDVRESGGELHAFLQRAFLTKTRNEWMEELGELNICVSPVNTVEEAIAHPQAAYREMVIDTDHPSVGRIKQIGSPLKMSTISFDVSRLPAPRLGEHTREILGSLGYGKGEIDELIKKGIVRE